MTTQATKVDVTRMHGGRSAAAMTAAATSGALIPLTIHLTLEKGNPFFYNTVGQTISCLLIVAFLRYTKETYYTQTLSHLKSKPAITDRSLLSLRNHLIHFKRTSVGQESFKTTLSRSHLQNPATWLKTPIVLTLIGALEIAILAWSTQFVDTAISATVYELWPAFVVFGLARHRLTNGGYLSQAPVRRIRWISLEHSILTIVAALGVIFMLGTQTGEELSDLEAFLTAKAVVGIGLALAAALLGALAVGGSLIYGEALYYRLTDGNIQAEFHNHMPIESRGADERKLLLWLTLFGVLIARGLGIPVNLAFALLATDTFQNLTFDVLLGATLVGAASFVTTVLIRLANVDAKRPGINAIYLCSPALALLLLAAAGIEVQRLDLFIIGAMLILATNVLIQVNPERNPRHLDLSKPEMAGVRLGFIVLTLAIWSSGTIIYLRDRFIPVEVSGWSLGDYLGLLGLSATIFALILGFRLSRLNSRVQQEDELMINLFHDCRVLYEAGVVSRTFMKSVCEFDEAGVGTLPHRYNDLHSKISVLLASEIGPEHRQHLVMLQRDFDKLAHSKQHGHDMVEPLALAMFAVVTAGLGLFARPLRFVSDVGSVSSVAPSYSGFLIECFAFLFVSTIAFLCVNLFDIKRERQLPLLAASQSDADDSGSSGGFVVYFRSRHVRVEKMVAVLVTIAMAVGFVFLFHAKWSVGS